MSRTINAIEDSEILLFPATPKQQGISCAHLQSPNTGQPYKSPTPSNAKNFSKRHSRRHNFSIFKRLRNDKKKCCCSTSFFVATAQMPIPVSKDSSFLLDAAGKPFPAIRFRADLAFEGEFINGLSNIFYNQQTSQTGPSFAPTLTGTAGGTPLSNDWKHPVWADLGFIKAPKGISLRQLLNKNQIPKA